MPNFFASQSSSQGNLGSAYPETATYLQQLQDAQKQLPSLTGLATGAPLLNVPGMDPTQTAQLQSFLNTANNNPDVAAARAQIAQLTGGPIGSSPATQAGMQAFTDLVAPQIATSSALRGTAGGGQGEEALAMGREAAAVPLIQQEITNRESAVGQLSGLGSQQMQQLAAALEASGMPREIAQQQAAAQFAKEQQNWQTQLGIQTTPQAWVPAQFGRTGTSTPSLAGQIGSTAGTVADIFSAFM